MQSNAISVADYLKSLPEDRRKAVDAVRNGIRANLDKQYEEGMQYGVIGYDVPHKVFPAGYHCDRKQPLPFAALASQKNHLALGVIGEAIKRVPAKVYIERYQHVLATTGKGAKVTTKKFAKTKKAA